MWHGIGCSTPVCASTTRLYCHPVGLILPVLSVVYLCIYVRYYNRVKLGRKTDGDTDRSWEMHTYILHSLLECVIDIPFILAGCTGSYCLVGVNSSVLSACAHMACSVYVSRFAQATEIMYQHQTVLPSFSLSSTHDDPAPFRSIVFGHSRSGCCGGCDPHRVAFAAAASRLENTG